MEALTELTRQMAREGIRRLLVLAGDPDWSAAQAQAFSRAQPEPVLWVSDDTDAPLQCSPRALTTLLGREFTHAVFDARSGFDVAAFAALSGTLSAGSWLILLTPALDKWALTPDADTCRWSDTAVPLPAPRFVTHFCRMLAHSGVLVWQQHQPFTVPHFAPREPWHPATGAPEREQAALLATLEEMPPGVMVVTAPRGRGKSALAGMHIARLPGNVIVTAPTRAATDVMAHYAGERFCFIAPDALAVLLSEGRTPDARWLIVDEAAAIPGPLLQTLVAGFSHTLLTTTVQGYEGTGQGFLLKFCAGFPHLRHQTLSTPLRWASGCPLENFVSDVLLFGDDTLHALPEGEAEILPLAQDSWLTSPERPAALYRLLASAHYRTSPLDLRRMMDAPGQSFWQAVVGEQPVAALWLVEEGGLSPALSCAVWAGLRRPRGNLVAQSLAAHGASPLAATLSGKRISRIAVHPYRQRQGIGEQLIEHVKNRSPDCDYLSVSFGYTRELWRFWQLCGFRLVRLGSYREASSGCYTAMAVIPLTDAGRALVEREQQRLARDLPGLAPWRDENLPLPVAEQTTLNDDDWLELGGFAFAHRPLSAASGALARLLAHDPLPLAAVRAQLEEGRDEAEICSRLRLAGRKALLATQRQETVMALRALDETRCLQLEERIAKLQLF
ncbi:tRNA(Met) cytidine acetyltransferase TmcA [Enterobacter sp.]|uniref:tRNA(Met) cytidine acetyltransferase TmcA n=1 Tax=Enterobacter sp. TaxID=42895 RepID=UPI00296F1C10|nr:GNAT family N-acetyltransferase [Enterobacter sp.]